MNFVLLDDIADHHAILSARLRELCDLHGWEGQVALATTSAADVCTYAAACEAPTVYFLDIELDDGATSLQICKAIQASKHRSYIIYVSAHPQYAMECLHTHAFDFLLKPWTMEQLEDCMTAVMRACAWPVSGETLHVNMGSRSILVPQEEIICFSREQMNTRLHRLDGSTVVWRESFRHLLPRLEEGKFLQCHRSCIVRLSQVQEVRWNEERLRLKNGEYLPISRRQIPALRRALDREVR